MTEIVCSLTPGELDERVAEFRRLFQASLIAHQRQPASLRLVFATPPEHESVVRDLFAREALCCPFYRFDFQRTGQGFSVRIGVPEEADAALDGFATLAARATH